MSGTRTNMRIDKWLWASRFYKTRALAAKACDLGRVRLDGALAKPARDVKIGDRLNVTNDSGLYEIEVVELSEIRGPAAAAQKLFSESEESREARAKLLAEKRVMAQFESLPEAKPTGRDRRMLNKFRGRER
ncbi:heat shock protein Hsp15 [Bryocella elongata]|uniref:Heat shock protein Hsp15 n=1 Tax=Bryocella elongata TaxID=863522 RepID=A0A1H5YL64_9BACT|nr:RNA-binding S4 domain-containing protein [Bryocella elongata]SEG24237.1 heat shock protein Hsp15 [Bryocella elongata]